jgi:hypothetical protein
MEFSETQNDTNPHLRTTGGGNYATGIQKIFFSYRQTKSIAFTAFLSSYMKIISSISHLPFSLTPLLTLLLWNPFLVSLCVPKWPSTSSLIGARPLTDV